MNKHLSAIRKAGAGSLFTPTKAMSRVRAIATDRTRASLTGGCSEPRIVRIYTEFSGVEGEPGRLGQPGLATSASDGPRDRRGQGSHAGERGVRDLTPPRRKRAIGTRVRRAGCSIALEDERRRDSHPFLLRNRSSSQKAQRQTALSRISRFGRRGVHATVKEVLTRAIAASEH